MRLGQVIAISTFLLATSATAQPIGPVGKLKSFSLSSIDAAVLARVCADLPDSPELKFDPCAAYILAAADGSKVAGEFCLESTSYSLQVVTISRRYLRDHPEKWSFHPYFVIRDALKSAFPCR